MSLRPFLTAAAAAGALILAACGSGQEAELTSAEQAQVETAAATLDRTAARELYADFLAEYVSERDGINFVAYGDVTEADHQALKTYITALENFGVEGLSLDEEMAFWFNLYNAKTIDIIVDNYPLQSIRSLGALNRGPWDRKVVNVTGFGEMSLNDIEHGTLRERWEEPRIHYAVNCASYGCPNLADAPWDAETLEERLDEAAFDYINHPRGFRVEGDKVIASKIFDWYKVDFGNTNQGVLEHAREYADGELAEALDAATNISKFEYDWSLNEG